MKLGIQSASRIVSEFFKHISDMPSVEVTAMCVRPQSSEKARAMLEAAGLAHVKLYTEEKAYLSDDSFDVTYNGTANHLHYEQAKRALLSGKHVILEKPFTVHLAEAEDLFTIAEEKGLKIWEAITTPYVPGYTFIEQNLKQIAPIHAVTINFSKYSTRYDDYMAGKWNTTFDPACAGGALMDMNVYCLHLVTSLFGRPEKTLYLPTVGKNGIDTGGLAALTYPGFNAALISCKDSTAPFSVVIQGERGYIEAPCSANALNVTRAVIGKQTIEGPVPEKFRMAYEFEYFAKCIREEDTDAYESAKEQSLTVMRLLDEMQKSIPAFTKYNS